MRSILLIRTAWQADGSYAQQQQQHWVKKDTKTERTESDGNDWDEGGARKASWADKVKGSESSDSAQKWVAKPEPDDEQTKKEKENMPGSNADLNAAAAVPSKADEADTESAKATGATACAAAEPSKPTWADKVRQGGARK